MVEQNQRASSWARAFGMVVGVLVAVGAGAAFRHWGATADAASQRADAERSLDDARLALAEAEAARAGFEKFTRSLVDSIVATDSARARLEAAKLELDAFEKRYEKVQSSVLREEIDRAKAREAEATSAFQSLKVHQNELVAKINDAKSSRPDVAGAVDIPSPFNSEEARRMMTDAALKAAKCTDPNGPMGQGKVNVTFAPTGRTATVTIAAGRFDGTSVGNCVANVFRGCRLRPFAGDPVTVTKSFSIGQ